MSSNKPHHDAEPDEIEEQGKDIIIRPRGLNIVWGKDTRYWHLPDKGKVDNPAELLQVSWLEVTGSATLTRGKTYEIGFSISLKADSFGWSGSPVLIMAKLGKKGRYNWRKKTKPLDQLENFPTVIPEQKILIPVPEEGENKIFFGLYEVWTGKWKGGLQIHHAFIREVQNPEV